MITKNIPVERQTTGKFIVEDWRGKDGYEDYGWGVVQSVGPCCSYMPFLFCKTRWQARETAKMWNKFYEIM